MMKTFKLQKEDVITGKSCGAKTIPLETRGPEYTTVSLLIHCVGWVNFLRLVLLSSFVKMR